MIRVHSLDHTDRQPLSPWSTLLRSVGFIVLVVVAFVTLGAVLHAAGVSLHTEGTEEGPKAFPNTFALLSIVVAATAFFGRLEHRSVGAYGLVDRLGLRRLVLGMTTGVGLFFILIAALVVTSAISFQVASHGIADATGWGSFWLATYLCVAAAEELLFRGYLLSTLAAGLGPWPAVIITSMLFGAAHLSNGLESPIAAVNGVLLGGVLAWSVLRSGSLWWAIGVHAGWDWSESFLAGAADSGLRAVGRLVTGLPRGGALWSGGDAGPEGSVIMLLPVALAAVACVTFLSKDKSFQ